MPNQPSILNLDGQSMRQPLIVTIFDKVKKYDNKVFKHKKINNLASEQIISHVAQFYQQFEETRNKLITGLTKYKVEYLRLRAQRKGEKVLDKMVAAFVGNLILGLGHNQLSSVDRALLCLGCTSAEQPFSRTVAEKQPIGNVTNLVIFELLDFVRAGSIDEYKIFLAVLFNQTQLERFDKLFYAAQILLRGSLFKDGLDTLKQEIFAKILALYSEVGQDYIFVNGTEFELWLDIKICLFADQDDNQRLATAREIQSAFALNDGPNLPTVYSRLRNFLTKYGQHTAVGKMLDLKNRVTLQTIVCNPDEILNTAQLNLTTDQKIVCIVCKLQGSDDEATIFEFSPQEAELYSLYNIVCKPDEALSWHLAKEKLKFKTAEDHLPAIVQPQPGTTKMQRIANNPILMQFRSCACKNSLRILAATAIVGVTVYAANNRDLMPQI